jgi:hypothetical protein
MFLYEKVFLIAAGVLLCASSGAQTWEEWTQQDQVKIKRLLEQIAANEVYIAYAQKGMKIISEGLTVIHDIKDGDFKLHLNFFDSLSIVRPAIKYSAHVKEIISFHHQIFQIGKKILNSARQSGQFTDREIEYFKNVFDRLFSDCVKTIDELMRIINVSANERASYQMKDNERIECIDKLFEDMRGKMLFTNSFANEIKIIAVQRLSETIDIDYLKIQR